MAKHLVCGDVVEGCRFEVGAETEEELLRKVTEHAAKEHGVREVTPELAAQVKAAIRTR
jgi:predicted small metal-binding protein